jgi:hypothetical protein
MTPVSSDTMTHALETAPVQAPPSSGLQPWMVPAGCGGRAGPPRDRFKSEDVVIRV